MKKKDFCTAVIELGESKGISNEAIIDAFNFAFSFAINKYIEDEMRAVSSKTKASKKIINKNADGEEVEVKKIDPIKVRVDCDLERGMIDTFIQKEVVENDDDITDDELQISLEEAKKKYPKIKVGEMYEIPFDFDKFSIKDVSRFISAFKQKISKAEKDALAISFSNKIHTIVSGTVEKADSRLVIVNLLGKANVTLTQKDLIGNETFRTGDIIKVYIKGIATDNKKDGLIDASRSCNEFLEKVFENEINEVYDKTIEIKQIARISGKKSKVAVISHDPNIDPIGSCIGKNGERIQKIVSQIGGKEHVDVVLYKENRGLYIAEILKPGEVIGVNFDDENNSAVVICKNDTAGVAISGGLNTKLLKMMLNLNNVRILNESELEQNEITSYKTIEQYLYEDEEEKREAERKRFREESIKFAEAAKKASDDSKSSISYPDFDSDDDFEEVENAEKKPIEIKIKIDSSNDEVKSQQVENEVKEVKEVVKEPQKEVEIEHKDVNTTTTLESLEKSLEEERNKKNQEKKPKKKAKKEVKETSEEKASVTSPTKKMDIYTEDELKEFEDDELYDDEYEDDDEDWSKYDSDDFYED